MPCPSVVPAKLWGLLLCLLPLREMRLTSGFGYRWHPIDHHLRFHAGIDLAAKHDTVYSILDGVVAACRYDPGLGLFVSIDHGEGWQSTYGHLSQWLILPGDTVAAGTPIGITGATGRVTGEHLHFALTFNKHYIDPLRFFRRMVIPDTTKHFNL